MRGLFEDYRANSLKEKFGEQWSDRTRVEVQVVRKC